jgi:coat protein Gp5
VANTFLKPEVIAQTALDLLQREIILPRLVWRFGKSDFAGAKDDTITVRVPAVLTARDYEWRTRGAAIELDDVTETGVDVTLDTHPYSAVAVTDEQLTLDIRDFGAQVLQPQVRAVAERLENLIASTLGGAIVPAAAEIAHTIGTTDGYVTAVRARRVLNEQNVPMAGRVLLLGAALEEDFLNSDHLTLVDQSGSDSALRDGTLGRILGFTVVTSNAIDPDIGYAFHKTAIAFGNVAPVVPDGATSGASVDTDNLAMRWIRDYDPNYLRDRSVVSSFAGAASVEEDGENMRLAKINMVAS